MNGQYTGSTFNYVKVNNGLNNGLSNSTLPVENILLIHYSDHGLNCETLYDHTGLQNLSNRPVHYSDCDYKVGIQITALRITEPFKLRTNSSPLFKP